MKQVCEAPSFNSGLQEAEGRSYANHPDMKFLLKKLIDDKKMSEDHAEGIMIFSEHVSSHSDYSTLKEGSTYVPLQVAMALKTKQKIEWLLEL